MSKFNYAIKAIAGIAGLFGCYQVGKFAGKTENIMAFCVAEELIDNGASVIAKDCIEAYRSKTDIKDILKYGSWKAIQVYLPVYAAGVMIIKNLDKSSDLDDIKIRLKNEAEHKDTSSESDDI